MTGRRASTLPNLPPENRFADNTTRRRLARIRIGNASAHEVAPYPYSHQISESPRLKFEGQRVRYFAFLIMNSRNRSISRDQTEKIARQKFANEGKTALNE
jgi:hypothetical protein